MRKYDIDEMSPTLLSNIFQMYLRLQSLKSVVDIHVHVYLIYIYVRVNGLDRNYWLAN